MRIHSLNKIIQLKQLRKKGYSISDLMKEFYMPKTTVWHHIHNIKLSKKYTALIKAKQGGSKIRCRNEWHKANKHAQKILNSENRYPCALVAMLYWAEGNKKDFVFTNTDGQMIKFYLTILKKYFSINGDDIKLTLRIFSNLNQKECLQYWSNITAFPKEKFIVYLNDGGTKGKAKYGICRLTIKKSGYLRKLITSLINNIIEEVTD